MEFTTIFILFFLIFVLYAIYHLLSSNDNHHTLFEKFENSSGGQKSYTDVEVQELMKQWGDIASQTGLDADTVKQKYETALSSNTKGDSFITMKRIEKKTLEQGTSDFLQNIYEITDRQAGILQDNYILSNSASDVKNSKMSAYGDSEQMNQADNIKKDTATKLEAERNKTSS